MRIYVEELVEIVKEANFVEALLRDNSATKGISPEMLGRARAYITHIGGWAEARIKKTNASLEVAE